MAVDLVALTTEASDMPTATCCIPDGLRLLASGWRRSPQPEFLRALRRTIVRGGWPFLLFAVLCTAFTFALPATPVWRLELELLRSAADAILPDDIAWHVTGAVSRTQWSVLGLYCAVGYFSGIAVRRAGRSPKWRNDILALPMSREELAACVARIVVAAACFTVFATIAGHIARFLLSGDAGTPYVSDVLRVHYSDRNHRPFPLTGPILAMEVHAGFCHLAEAWLQTAIAAFAMLGARSTVGGFARCAAGIAIANLAAAIAVYGTPVEWGWMAGDQGIYRYGVARFAVESWIRNAALLVLAGDLAGQFLRRFKASETGFDRPESGVQ